MNDLVHAAALNAEENACRGELRTQFVLGTIGRILVVGAGLAVGAILGLIAGLALGMIHFSC